MEWQVLGFQCVECGALVDIVEEVSRENPSYLSRCPNPECPEPDQSLGPTEATDFDGPENMDLKRQHGYMVWSLPE